MRRCFRGSGGLALRRDPSVRVGAGLPGSASERPKRPAHGGASAEAVRVHRPAGWVTVGCGAASAEAVWSGGAAVRGVGSSFGAWCFRGSVRLARMCRRWCFRGSVAVCLGMIRGLVVVRGVRGVPTGGCLVLGTGQRRLSAGWAQGERLCAGAAGQQARAVVWWVRWCCPMAVSDAEPRSGWSGGRAGRVGRVRRRRSGRVVGRGVPARRR